MVTPQIVALADEVQAHLDRGDLTGVGPINFGPDGILPHADQAARIVLADLAHCLEQESAGHPSIPAERWAEIADQLGCLERAVRQKLTPSRPGDGVC